MQPLIFDNESGKVSKVKNLAWLLVHSSEIDEIFLDEIEHGAGMLVAGGTRYTYVYVFDSFAVGRDWLHVRSEWANARFAHCQITVKWKGE